MRWSKGSTAVAAALALLSSGCGERLLLTKSGMFAQRLPTFFWPPPDSTSVWAADSKTDLSFGQAAERVVGEMRRAGYVDVRWYPIGVRYVHGFALTTRLERLTDGSLKPAPQERWFPLFPEAPSLEWLGEARFFRTPGPGRYRVFLVAFTDLPVGHDDRHRAPRHDEQTLMDAPGMPTAGFPTARRVSPGYQLAVYVYEYESDVPDGEGGFVGNDEKLSTVTHIQASGLSELAALAKVGASDP